MLKNFITEEHQAGAIRDLQRLVKIPSYLQPAISGAPFGSAILACLKDCLALFADAGFSTFIDPDGYYGYAEIGPEGPLFGVLCHLDVVPPGDLALWESPAFEGTLREGAIFGRGVQDDKGPTIAALYAVKSLVEAGVTFNKRIRFIFGTDEENLWRCMERYHQKESAVEMGIAPDAKFPVIYAEKGLLQVTLKGPASSTLTFQGGSALNVVPDSATYQGQHVDEVLRRLAQLGYQGERLKDQICVKGRAIHAKDAPKGINAISRLAIALASIYEHPVINFLGKLVKEDGNGVNVLGDICDEASGALTFNVGTVELNQEGSSIGLDIRIPVTVTKAEIVEKLTQVAASYGLLYEEHDFLEALYVPVESELVTTLLSVYQEVTGEGLEPQVSGGATYARTMPNCVAFGAMFTETKDTMHQPNEEWQLKEMNRTMVIYAEALYRLCSQN